MGTPPVRAGRSTSTSLSRRDPDTESQFTPSWRLPADSADERMINYGASPVPAAHMSPSNPRVLPYGEELDAHLSVIHAYYQAQVRATSDCTCDRLAGLQGLHFITAG